MSGLRTALEPLPLVAILRGVRPDEAAAIGSTLYDAGFRIIEVPLNSPEPFESIRVLAETCAADALIGAGTVLTSEDVGRVRDAGGRLIVMPHTDPAVIAAAKQERLIALPGTATPSEAFGALAAGADGLKMFPAEALPPAVVKAWRAALPPDVPLLPVGGITPEHVAPYLAAGADGFGLGSALYRPGMSAGELLERARGFVRAVGAARAGGGTGPGS